VTRKLRGQYGTSPTLFNSLRRICSSKILTYRALSRFQPSSFVYSRWNRAAESWLKELASDYLLFKPPRGSCGRGILVLRREEFPRQIRSFTLTSSVLLQEYTESRKLFDESGRPHMGCIRHIVHVYSDSESMNFLHLPSYWRVAAVPFEHHPPRGAFTANISTGAYPLAVEGLEAQAVRNASEEILGALFASLLDKELPSGESEYVSPEGSVLASRTGRLTSTPASGK
jgi:hypothetical protein